MLQRHLAIQLCEMLDALADIVETGYQEQKKSCPSS